MAKLVSHIRYAASSPSPAQPAMARLLQTAPMHPQYSSHSYAHADGGGNHPPVGGKLHMTISSSFLHIMCIL